MGPGEGRDRPERREGSRPARVGELARARRRVRHVPARRGVLRDRSPAVSTWLGDFHYLRSLPPEQASLADLGRRAHVPRLGAPHLAACVLDRARTRGHQARVARSQTWRDIVDGLQFIRSNPLVRGVMIGLAGGLTRRRHRSSRSARCSRRDVLGGGRVGVRLPDDRARHRCRDRRRDAAVVATTAAARRRCSPRRSSRRASRSSSLARCRRSRSRSCSSRSSARARVARTSPGSRCCRRAVTDEMRGRMFATLYTRRARVPAALADGRAVRRGRARRRISNAIDERLGARSVPCTSSLPGVRLALWLGGADHDRSPASRRARRMRKAQRADASSA